MIIEVYLKGGQTIVLDHVEEAEFKHDALSGFTSYSLTFDKAWKRKPTHMVLSEIAAVCRVEE